MGLFLNSFKGVIDPLRPRVATPGGLLIQTTGSIDRTRAITESAVQTLGDGWLSKRIEETAATKGFPVMSVSSPLGPRRAYRQER
jgi:hypothetical protein